MARSGARRCRVRRLSNSAWGFGRSRATLCAVIVAAAAHGHVQEVGSVLAAGTFNDPENARIIWLMAGGLLALGVLVALGTIWWWRSSRVEHPALGPLEVMGSRSWWKGDYSTRRRSLEAARPTGAEPAGASARMTGDPVDLEAAALASPSHFDDLQELPTSAEAVAEPISDAELAEAYAELELELAAAELVDVEVAEVDPAEVDPAEVDSADVAPADLDGAEPSVESAAVTDVEVRDPDFSEVESTEVVSTETADPEPVVDERPLGDADDTSVSAEVPRPIDPLLRLNSE